MEHLREKAVDFIYKVFAKDCLNNELSFNSDLYLKTIDGIYNEITKNVTPVNDPFMIRLGGQCGSGKTTQLVPAIKSTINCTNYIHLAVRLFAKCHPYYDELINKYGIGLIREKTNGFALLCLFGVLEKLIKNKYNILFEVTILEPEFERYIINLAKNYNYSFSFHIMSVPFVISNNFANERTNSNGNEKNRIMPKETLDYFYDVLSRGINEIINNAKLFNENDYVIIWNITDSEPVLVTNKFDINVLNIFNKYRIFNDSIIIKDIETKLGEKINFYNKFFNN